MSNTPAKLTRLELVIIVSALVVLLLSNQPPERGSADIRKDIGQLTDTPETLSQVQPDPTPSDRIRADDVAVRSPATLTPDNLTVPSIPQPQPQAKRLGMVDARACRSLNYPNIMYGEITVRWVWNGTKFEPCKVCEIRESNGIVTVWSFDEHEENVTITEVSEDEVPSY